MPVTPYSDGVAIDREPADHVAVDDVVIATARRAFALAGQDAEIVAAHRIALIATLEVSALFA